jgi:hypothetical protein
MVKKTSKRAKTQRVPRSLVNNRLEDVSKDVFRKHYSLITELVGDSPGIYALYDGSELYYVGKSTELRKRVRNHLRDRHLASWTHFSLYLTRREEHIHEIESLLVRVANPKGNRVLPRGRSTGALLKKLRSLIKERQKRELEQLFGAKRAGRRENHKRAKHGKSRVLAGLVQVRTPIFKTYKGKDYKATLSPSGSIRFGGSDYGSPTAAAKAVIRSKRAVNGWTFWYIQDSADNWVRLGEYKP